MPFAATGEAPLQLRPGTTEVLDGRWSFDDCGGCPPETTWHANPQLGIVPQSDSAGGSLTFALSADGVADKDLALWVLEAERSGERKAQWRGFVVKSDQTPSLTLQLRGRQAFVLYVATLHPEQRASFKLSMDNSSGTCDVLCQALTAEPAHLDTVAPPPPPASQSYGPTSSASIHPPEPPPTGWRTAFDHRGGLYYYHEETREAQYARPHVHGGDGPALPGGWRAHTDSEGKSYYWNETTYGTTYTVPSSSSSSRGAASYAPEASRVRWAAAPGDAVPAAPPSHRSGDDDRFMFDPPLPERTARPSSASAPSSSSSASAMSGRAHHGTHEREHEDPSYSRGDAPFRRELDDSYRREDAYGRPSSSPPPRRWDERGRDEPTSSSALREQVVEVEKEAMRLRGMLSDAQAAWERGVMTRLPKQSVQAKGDERLSKPTGDAAARAKAAKQQKEAQAAASNRQAQERWARRQETARTRASNPKALNAVAADRLALLAQEALLSCQYGPEVLRIKMEKRKPLHARAAGRRRRARRRRHGE